jgi:phage gp45-like
MSGLMQLWQRVLNIVAPGKLTICDDSGSVMRCQFTITHLEVLNGVPVLQQFGLSSVPPAGSDGIAVFLGGDRSNSAIIATGDQGTRPSGKAAGETVIFNAFGMTIALSASGITINGGGKPVTITNAPTVTQNGDLHVTGAVVAGSGGSDQVSLQTHRHGTGTAASGTIAPSPGT